MKRLFQFVVFGLMLLAAAQPLLADTACDHRQCEGTPVCLVCFDRMAIPSPAPQNLLADLQAAPQVAFADARCGYGWCQLRSDGSSLLVATPLTVRLANGGTLFIPVAQFSASHAVILTARSSEDVATSAVPRHILFQVFRI